MILLLTIIVIIIIIINMMIIGSSNSCSSSRSSTSGGSIQQLYMFSFHNLQCKTSYCFLPEKICSITLKLQLTIKMSKCITRSPLDNVHMKM